MKKFGKTDAIDWLDDAESHNYPAASSYLSLIYPQAKVAELVARLKKAPLTQFKAKDIFRASRLSLLGISNLHIQKVQRKMAKDKKLSPILLVRDPANGNVIIADGYHRMCAIYSIDEDSWIRCKIV